MKDDFHYFIVTSINNDLKKKKIIFSDTACIKNFNDKKKFENTKNITLIDNIWGNAKQTELDYLLIERLINTYSINMGNYLNAFHGLTKPQKHWDILILPWLIYYLSSMLYRWRVAKKALAISNKNFFFYNYKIINDLKIYTTIDFLKYSESSESFNYILFKKIVDYLSNENNIKFLDSNDTLNHPFQKKRTSLHERVKFFLFKSLDKLIIFFSKKNSIYIEKNLFSLCSYLKLNLKLKLFPQNFKFLFNYKLDNRFLDNIIYNQIKRKNIEFKNFKKTNEEHSFQDFLDTTIKFDIPLCFLEGYDEIVKKNKTIKINPKIILSAYHYTNNERFKLWVADQVCLKNTKFLVAEHGGGEQMKFNGSFKSSKKVADKRITWTKPRIHKDHQLPVLGIVNLKRKNEKYLSYVELPQDLFANQLGSYKFNYTNMENILSLRKNLSSKPLNSLRYLPYKKVFNPESSDIKKILNKKYINKEVVLRKFIPISKIIICTYAGTSFTESLLTGPTILICDKYIPSWSDSRGDLMDTFRKCKIVFNDPKKACDHINSIWDSPHQWWNTNEVQIAIEQFKSEFIYINKKPLKSWYRFLKEELNK